MRPDVRPKSRPYRDVSQCRANILYDQDTNNCMGGIGHASGEEPCGFGFHIKQRNQVGREHIAALRSSPGDFTCTSIAQKGLVKIFKV